MKFSDFIVNDAIVPELAATDRNGVIRELVGALATAGRITPDQVEDIAKTVIRRENSGTTGFGKGIAVPHSKLDNIPHIMAALGRCKGGVDFQSLDRAPVYAVFLLLCPENRGELHIQAMESIFRHMGKDSFRRNLRQAESKADIMALLTEADGAPA